MSTILERLDELEHVLVGKGWPPMSPWWRGTFDDFYRSTRQRCVLRVGRRGGKSSSLCRIAVLEALYGGHEVPPGDVGFVVIASVRKDEALARLRTIKSILDALRVKYRESDGAIELVGRRTGFKVIAASIAAASGWTSICILGDEISKWRDADTGTNPATEVLNALRPTMATMPHAREFLSSSPVGLEDAHAKHFEEGTNDEQLCVAGASWTANPTLTEAQCRRLANDERVFRREYAAIPQGALMGAFSPDAIEAAFRPAPPNFTRLGSAIVALDPSGRGSDLFTFCAAGWCAPYPESEDIYEIDEDISDRENGLIGFKLSLSGQPVVRADFVPPEPILLFNRFSAIDSSYRTRGAMIGAEEIYDAVAATAIQSNARKVVSDQFEAFSAEAWLRRHGLQFVSYPWGSTTKSTAVSRLRGYLNSRRVIISAGEHTENLRRQLLAYEERVGSNGVSYGGKDPTGSHFDLLSTMITAVMADAAGDMFGSPATNKRRGSMTVQSGFKSTA